MVAKILLVDDVPEQLTAYRRLLHRRFEILTAESGDAALDVLKREPAIDVIVSDMSMPGMSGTDFFVRAAEMAPAATRIMLTGNMDMNATIDAINRGGVFRYLQKPCASGDLIGAVEDGLKLRSTPTADAPGDTCMLETPVTGWLEEAMQDCLLKTFFQPIVDLRTGAIVGAEALARWLHPADGWIPPSVFIPIAEQSGLMPELGRRMLIQACREAAGWRARGFEVAISVNASVTQFVEGQMISDVHLALEDSNLPPEKLTLELTESVLIHDPDKIIRMLEELRAIGVTLAIDDFGTGYSSLAYLKHLPIDRLKIDRCFVQDIDRDERDLSFVRTMLELARHLGLSVVAEGIERPAQRQLLMDLGCRMGQGFLFAKAIDGVGFVDLLARPSMAEHGPSFAELAANPFSDAVSPAAIRR
jgi:EAL domain-containing protein (putative c-di-GMP-specific phosphodiesterase class I)